MSIFDDIQKRLKSTLKDIDKEFARRENEPEQPRVKWEDIDYCEDELYEDHNPYEKGSWRGAQWHCIRCGGKLLPMPKADWKHIKNRGALDFLCENEKCCHHGAPLTLHHPFGIDTEAGESYSVSWIK